jgi:predicted DNA-binding transcriptional regulator AlpA
MSRHVVLDFAPRGLSVDETAL